MTFCKPASSAGVLTGAVCEADALPNVVLVLRVHMLTNKAHMHVAAEMYTYDLNCSRALATCHMYVYPCLCCLQERVIGVHYLGPNAGEIIQGMAIAVRARATKADFDDTIGIHPTTAEEFTILEVRGDSSCNRKALDCFSFFGPSLHVCWQYAVVAAWQGCMQDGRKVGCFRAAKNRLGGLLACQRPEWAASLCAALLAAGDQEQRQVCPEEGLLRLRLLLRIAKQC